MSVINAIAEVQSFRAINSDVNMKECCRLLRVRPGAASTFDYEAVEDLHAIPALFEHCSSSREQGLRGILKILIIHFRPTWGLLMPHGRRVLRQSVPPDIKQCFESAGFFKDSPDPESIIWWDGLSSYFRSNAVLGRVEMGRRGEMLSMNHERDRLVAAGHTQTEPLWSAIEDETLGYDITSWDLTGPTPKIMYIEVKASERTPFVFFLTENEWKVAQMFKETYVFHFWYLPTQRLKIVTVDEVASHLPINQGSGVWKKTQIEWPIF